MQKVSFLPLVSSPHLIFTIHAPAIQCDPWINKIIYSKFNTCDVQLLNALMLMHYIDLLALVKYIFSNNKLLRNLEGKGDKGKEDFLHKSHVIMEYNIAHG